MKILKIAAITFAVFLFLSGRPAQATPSPLTLREMQTILALIEALTAQVRLLQAQLLEMQMVQNTPPVIQPQGATGANTRLVEGVAMPKLWIEARILRTEQRGERFFYEERPVTGKAVLRDSKESLRILVGVGNPDPAFAPAFSCERFGQWSGPVTHDQWFEGVRADGTLGVRCTSQDGQVEEIALAVEHAAG